MKFKLVLAILAVFMMTPYAWAEPWWENAQIQQTLTERSIDQEVCGSGIDEDGVGGDAPCPGGDSDLDGYKDEVDCEPFNKFVYPGISTTCDINGGKANGWKTCQSDGTFTPCVDSAVQPLCEAQGDGHCYYFDPVNGDNGNDGSYEHPWKDYAKINFFSPIRYFAQPGDVFYFKSGIYNPIYKPTYPEDAPTDYQGFRMYGVGDANSYPIIIKNYPGEHPVFRPDNDGEDNSAALEYCTNTIFEGIEITAKPDIYHVKGLAMVETKDVIARNVYVHDVNTDYCGGNTGCVAFWVGVQDSEIRTSIVHDCHKYNCVGSGNVRLIFINSIGTGVTKVLYNTVFTRKDLNVTEIGARAVPALIAGKHGSNKTGSGYEIGHNILFGIPYAGGEGQGGTGTRQYNTYIHNNILFNMWSGVEIEAGGWNDHCNERFEYNTIVNARALFKHTLWDSPDLDPDTYLIDPATGENSNECENLYGTLNYSHNIVIDSQIRNFENAFIMIGLYCYDDSKEYDTFIGGGNLHMDNNCYYHTLYDLKTSTNAVSFYYGRHSKGKLYTMEQWQTDDTSKPFKYDVNSIVEDPLLKTDDGSFMPQNPNAKDKGWLAGATTEVIWDIDGDKKWSLPDIIYGLEVLAGKRK